MRPLTPRLAMVADEVRRCTTSAESNCGTSPLVVDVGCDHAGLSLTLLHEGLPARIVAVDCNAAPCARARANALALGLPLDVRQGGGLDPVEGFVEVVSMCGVGSGTAVEVLEGARDRVGAAVVQPNDDGAGVRAWARGAGWRVARQRAVWDRGRYYGALVLAPGAYDLDYAELMWGVGAQVDREALGRRLRGEIARLGAFPAKEMELRWAKEALRRLGLPG